MLLDFAHSDPVEADGIGAIRRARGKDSGKAAVGVGSRTNFQDGAVGWVQPGQNEKVVAGRNSIEGGESEVLYVEPSVGCAFRALLRGVLAIAEGGANDADWA